MGINQGVIAGDVGMVGRDVADATHVSREVIDLVNTFAGLQAVLPETQVEKDELVCRTCLVIGGLEIHPAHPKPIIFQTLDQMVTDESTRAGHKNPRLCLHRNSSLCCRVKGKVILSGLWHWRQAKSLVRNGKTVQGMSHPRCNCLHCCDMVFGTNEPFSFIFSAINLRRVES